MNGCKAESDFYPHLRIRESPSTPTPVMYETPLWERLSPSLHSPICFGHYVTPLSREPSSDGSKSFIFKTQQHLLPIYYSVTSF